MNKARVNIYMDKSVHKMLKRLAVEKERPFSQIIEELIKDFLMREGFYEQEDMERADSN